MSNELIRELVEALNRTADFLPMNGPFYSDAQETLAKARAYLETGEWNVSDVMLCGMLRMPLEMHLADDVFGPPQLQSRMLEAADELEKRANRIAELERENEALRKDAERYRWLRTRNELTDGIDPRGPWVTCDDETCADYPTAKQLDAAIDAALKEQSKC